MTVTSETLILRNLKMDKCNYCGKKKETKLLTDLHTLRMMKICSPCNKKSRKSSRLG